MSKLLLIDAAHSEEIRVAIADGNKLEKFEFESISKKQIKGNIYLAKVVRVEPSLQAVFVDYGQERHGFLSFSEIHPNYYQIPISDKEELENHIQNAVAQQKTDNEDNEDLDEDQASGYHNVSKLRYQFYKRYKVQEVIKKRQVMLIQVVKEERGNKGAALTTYISLAGRYCVLLPNTDRTSGISKKITSPSDRKKLKKILSELNIGDGMCTVIRTAGINRTKQEITKDFNYALKTWDEIRETTLKSQAPCLIHEETGLIKRAIRDMYSKDVDEIIVEGEDGYKLVKDFIKKMLPGHTKKVKQHASGKVSLFSKYEINDQINSIYTTKVDLPSGGYLVINNTEALTSIDVNSGKSTKERNIGSTALKTNLEAAVEIVRQCKLRDLGGLIVVDFIDMTDEKNNQIIEKTVKEKFKDDKAKVQIGSISSFGLLELSRQRIRQSLLEANRVQCPCCDGSGSVWSTESITIQAIRKLEEVCSSMDVKEVKITLSPQAALYLLNNKRLFISSLEEQKGCKIIVDMSHNMSLSDFVVEPVMLLNNKLSKEDSEDIEISDDNKPNQQTKIGKNNKWVKKQTDILDDGHKNKEVSENNKNVNAEINNKNRNYKIKNEPYEGDQNRKNKKRRDVNLGENLGNNEIVKQVPLSNKTISTNIVLDIASNEEKYSEMLINATKINEEMYQKKLKNIHETIDNTPKDDNGKSHLTKAKKGWWNKILK